MERDRGARRRSSPTPRCPSPRRWPRSRRPRPCRRCRPARRPRQLTRSCGGPALGSGSTTSTPMTRANPSRATGTASPAPAPTPPAATGARSDRSVGVTGTRSPESTPGFPAVVGLLAELDGGFAPHGPRSLHKFKGRRGRALLSRPRGARCRRRRRSRPGPTGAGAGAVRDCRPSPPAGGSGSGRASNHTRATLSSSGMWAVSLTSGTWPSTTSISRGDEQRTGEHEGDREDGPGPGRPQHHQEQGHGVGDAEGADVARLVHRLPPRRGAPAPTATTMIDGDEAQQAPHHPPAAGPVGDGVELGDVAGEVGHLVAGRHRRRPAAGPPTWSR